MRNKKFLFVLITLCVIYVALMTIFTFCDYKVTNYLYNPGTVYGMICEAIGPMFMPLFVIFSTVGLIILCDFKKKSNKIFSRIGLGFVYLYGTFMGVMTHKHSYVPWMFIPSIIIYVSFTIFIVLFNLRIKKNESDLKKNYFKLLLITFITTVMSLIGVDIIKCVFGRVRYINLLKETDFKYWFYINKFDFNSSFPSGHAARAMTVICFSLIPKLFNKKRVSYLVEGLGVLFALTIAVSRLFEGMHYLTDITTGLFVVYVTFFISKQKLSFKNKNMIIYKTNSESKN